MRRVAVVCRSPEEQEGAMKRAQVRQRIEQYYYQLTEGCGDTNCANANCCSNVQVMKRSGGKVGG